MVRILLITGLALLALAAAPAQAEAFRCGTRIVTDGDSAAKVVALCGEPTEIRRSAILRRPVLWLYGRPYYLSDDLVEVPVETWTYNLGPHKLMRQLRFEDGVLVEVTTLGHGYNEP
ncbi:MAG: DUF2845 domain-containing protein [Steroidobacteraceae bacterium]|jgi:hypothetical protein|nr:DUF2845 domain-containing protein [Steroidobacteraceae bacterium]